MSTHGSLGALLRAFRGAAGLTQEELAERSGLSVDAIGMLERGARRAPRSGTVELLAKALGLAPEQREALVAAARARAANAAVHLPVELQPPASELIGREEALVDVCRLLGRPDVRLLTLTGPPGVGKTRLGAEAALGGAGGSAEAVYGVGLASVSDPGQVGPAICQALGLRDQSGQGPVEIIRGHLGDRPALLLLDNLEHLLPATALLLELLAACPNLRLLVTSRTSLAVRDEHVIAVPPLALADAVRLFARLTSARLPALILDDRSHATFVEVCRRLDGLPLALELAAAWLELLGPDGLLARLGHPLPLLERGPADLPERQRTLRHTLRWSHDLLSPDGQAAFRRLAVFAGGATVEAAELVCQAPGALAGGCLPALAELVDHHLVVAESGPERRVAMLHVVREFGRELLDASGERAAAEEARLRLLAELVGGAGADMVGERQVAWFDRLAREHQDLRGALGWAVEHDVVEGLRLATGLARYWDWRGHCVEGDEWMERLLATDAPIDDDLLAEALRTSGVMRLRLGRYAACEERFRPARELFERAGDRHGVAMVLNGMGNVERLQGRDASGIGMLEEALCHFRALDDPVGTAGVLGNLGVAAKYRGETKRAMALHREALDIRRAIDDRFGICLTLSNLAGAACEEGSYELAAGWLAECVPMARQLGDRSALITALGQLGDVAGARGAHAEAAAHYLVSLELVVEIGEPMNMISSLAGLVLAAARQGFDRRAARLAGAAVSLHEAYGREHPSAPRPEWDQVLAEVQARMGAAAYQEAFAAGGTLSLAEAMAVAAEP